MKNIIIALIALSSISAIADTCIGTPDNMAPGEHARVVVPGACVKQIKKGETTAILSGLYQNAGDGLLIGFKKRANKDGICQTFGFFSYVDDSAVVMKKNIFISRQGQLIPGEHRVLDSVTCKL